VVDKVPNLGKNSWVSTVIASRYNEGTAYATFESPYLWRYEAISLQDNRFRQHLDTFSDRCERHYGLCTCDYRRHG